MTECHLPHHDNSWIRFAKRRALLPMNRERRGKKTYLVSSARRRIQFIHQSHLIHNPQPQLILRFQHQRKRRSPRQSLQNPLFPKNLLHTPPIPPHPRRSQPQHKILLPISTTTRLTHPLQNGRRWIRQEFQFAQQRYTRLQGRESATGIAFWALACDQGTRMCWSKDEFLIGRRFD